MNTLMIHKQQSVDPTTMFHEKSGLLAMQYSYRLPADYDMANIRSRIASKGHLMDGFPDLLFKAFAYSASDYNYRYSPSNFYAPFYLWQNPRGMTHFLESDGFAALMQTFGRPEIKTWAVLHAQFRDSYPITSWATREIQDIPSNVPLTVLQRQESIQIQREIASKKVLGAFSAYEPQTWKLVRYKLLSTCPVNYSDNRVQIYQVGHLATRNTPVQ